MKIYAENKLYPLEITLFVDVYLDNPYISVKSSENIDKIKMVTFPDGKVDTQALSDWNTFVKNAALVVSETFKVIKIDKSAQSFTSTYFWIYAKSEDGQIAVNTLVRLRLSDHIEPEDHDYDAEHVYVNTVGKRLPPVGNRYPRHVRTKEIIISGDEQSETHHCSTYHEALDRLSECLEDIRESYVE